MAKAIKAWTLPDGSILEDPKWDANKQAFVGTLVRGGVQLNVPFAVPWSLDLMPQIVKGTRGFFSRTQGEAITRLVQDTATVWGAVVEIGTFAGLSASWIGWAIKSNPADHRVLQCIDPFIGVLGSRVPGPAEWRENLQRIGLIDTVMLHQTHSQTMAPVWKKPISFLFIDGDHGYLGARYDLMMWGKHVLPGGIMTVHDTNRPKFPGITRAIKDVIEPDPSWEPITATRSMSAWRKR